jgi:hypothetical protein
MIKFVTTINQKLYTEYGRRALSEFDQFCGERVEMSLVFEGKVPEDIECYKHISIRSAESKGRTDFTRRFEHLKELNGLVIKYLDEDKTKLQISYNYRYNAIRFAHKIFSICEEFERRKEADDYLVWIDADIRVLKAFDDSALLRFLPEPNQIASYLGRNSFPKPNPYSEGGWYGFNLNHPQVENFILNLSELYTTGELFTLKEWHDCMAFDKIRMNYESAGGKFKNLSAGIEDLEHPFINCGLEEYFDHLKGPERKRLGRSRDTDKRRRN